MLIRCTLSSITFTEGDNELLTVSLDVPVGWTAEAHPVPGMWHLVHRVLTRACVQPRQELFQGVTIASPIKGSFVWKAVLVGLNCMCAGGLDFPSEIVPYCMRTQTVLSQQPVCRLHREDLCIS